MVRRASGSCGRLWNCGPADLRPPPGPSGICRNLSRRDQAYRENECSDRPLVGSKLEPPSCRAREGRRDAQAQTVASLHAEAGWQIMPVVTNRHLQAVSCRANDRNLDPAARPSGEAMFERVGHSLGDDERGRPASSLILSGASRYHRLSARHRQRLPGPHLGFIEAQSAWLVFIRAEEQIGYLETALRATSS
jgi:hypothetical protein